MNSFPSIDHNEQAGGNASFKFAPHIWIYAIPLAVSGKVISDINMNGDYSFLDGVAALDSISFEETMTENAAGRIWQQSVKGFYPKYTEDINALMHEMAAYRFVLIVKDKNGVSRIAGNEKEPLKFRYQMSSGNRVSDKSGLEFEFSGSCTAPSPVYDPA